jgi:hypothetical protein
MASLIVADKGEGTSHMVSRKSILALAGGTIGQARKSQTIVRYLLLVEEEQARKARARKSGVE